jgi:hypothetical protein
MIPVECASHTGVQVGVDELGHTPVTDDGVGRERAEVDGERLPLLPLTQKVAVGDLASRIDLDVLHTRQLQDVLDGLEEPSNTDVPRDFDFALNFLVFGHQTCSTSPVLEATRCSMRSVSTSC